jgi:thiamine-phosphate pyrophosphorylase
LISLRRYYITDSRAVGGCESLLRIVRQQLAAGVEMIQIREKHLAARELFELTKAVVSARGNLPAQILVNTRADIAAAGGADGVHLAANAPKQTLPGLLVGRSCHTLEEVARCGADFVTFGPVFESPGKGTPVGLAQLRAACALSVPVYALGGITWDNAVECLDAGAAGIAGIRIFQEQA